jgi:hypothetical protein
MHMIHTIQIMQQSTYNMNSKVCNKQAFNMTIEKDNLISENETSNKSKNPAPDYEKRIALLWFGRLERSRKILLNRAYTYINIYIIDLIFVQWSICLLELY